MITEIPNPGSDEALERGCTCARIDNHYGKGFYGKEGPRFWITENCPLHDNPDTYRIPESERGNF